MNRIVLILVAFAAVLFGTAGVADAYPPVGALITVSNANPEPGATVNVTVDCGAGSDGAAVTVTLGDQTATGTCQGGSATVSIQVPSTPGTYNGSVFNQNGTRIGGFAVTVTGSTTGTPATPSTPAGTLPATGSNGTQTTTLIAGGLLVVGLGLFAVATMRRRQTAAI